MRIKHAMKVVTAMKIIVTTIVMAAVWKHVIFWMTTYICHISTAMYMLVARTTTMLTTNWEIIEHRCVNKITLELFDISSIVRTWTTKCKI